MCDKLYSAIKNNKKEIFFFPLYLFNKNLYNNFNFQKIE